MKSKKCYIVQMRMNLDDPVVGVYPTLKQARNRALAVFRHPEKSVKYVQAGDVSGFIGVSIYRAQGARITPLQDFWKEDDDA